MNLDESLTKEVIIFNEPISPKIYYNYWKELIGHSPKVIPGCLGGPLATLEYFKNHNIHRLEKEIKRKNEYSQYIYEMAHLTAKKMVGIDNQLDTLFISGGGTTVWDEVLENLIDDYANNEPNYNVLIFSPTEVKKRNIRLRSRDYIKCGHYKHDKLVFLSVGNTFTETHHVLFPAFDLVLTRAGGGTVNDAIACRVPLVLVEEPFMWQVEQIRKSCIKLRIAEGVSLKKFQENPRRCVELQNGKLKILNKQEENILRIPNHSETWLVQKLINLVYTKSF